MKKSKSVITMMMIATLLGSCRYDKRTTPDGTMVDRNEGHSQEVLDNRGGQSQTSDTANHNTVQDKTEVLQDTTRSPRQ